MAPMRPFWGYVFDPTDEEIARIFLKRKIDNEELPNNNLLREAESYEFLNPETFSEQLDTPVRMKAWFFFIPRDHNADPPNRAAGGGYWKADESESDTEIEFEKVKVGYRRDFKFIKGESEETDWVMHEFRVNEQEIDDWVLCKIFKEECRSSEPDWSPRTSSSTDSDQ